MSDLPSPISESGLASSLASSPTWKMIYLARRNTALAAKDFPQAWREHSALGRQCKSVGQRVKAVAQCARVLQANSPALSAAYDGVNLLVLADRESGAAIWNDPETLAVMRPDEPRVFADYVRNFSMLCREQLLFSSAQAKVRPGNGDTLLIGFLQVQSPWSKATAVDEAALQAVWKELGIEQQALRVVCNLIDEEPPAGYGYRYVVEWWFSGVEQAQAAAAKFHAVGAADDVLVLTTVTHSRS